MKKITVKNIVYSAIIAALYVAITAAFAPISFGAIQVRISESLTLLPLFTPFAIPGLFIGCLISNIIFSGTLIDIVLGSLATLVAATLTYYTRKNKYIAAFFPVAINAVVVAYVLKVSLGAPFALSMLTVAIGQFISCYAIGIPLTIIIEKYLPKNLFGKSN